MTALRGINLGGWLVLERWMTPQVFEGTKSPDERSLIAEIGLEAAKERINRHRDEFITEKDFEFIKSTGCDFVRLPIAYWLFQETGEYISGQEYVDRAMKWAKRHDLGVILDFHGLPGSQNGKIHSGSLGRVEFYQAANIEAAVASVEYVAKRYGGHPTLVGLQVINEPEVRLCARRLLQYYDRAYQAADQWLAPGVKIIVSDAFMPKRMAWLVSKRGYGERIVLDIHLYQVFGKQFQNWLIDRHLDFAASRSKMLVKLGQRLPIMVGEWSGALPGSARHKQLDAEKKFIDIQQKVYDENVWAHCYWSYKKTGRGAWNWRATLYDK